MVIENSDKLKRILGNTVQLLNVTRLDVARNKDSIKQLTEQVARQEYFYETIKPGLNTQVLLQRINQRVAVPKLIEVLLWDITRHITKLETMVNTVMMGRVTPLVLAPGELRAILKNITASLPAGMFLPYNVRQDLLGIYRSLSVATLPHSMGLLIICQIPILSSKGQFDFFFYLLLAQA